MGFECHFGCLRFNSATNFDESAEFGFVKLSEVETHGVRLYLRHKIFVSKAVKKNLLEKPRGEFFYTRSQNLG